MFWLCLYFFVTISSVQTLDNGLALLPPMGWNHWLRFKCTTDCSEYPDECISESLFITMADHMTFDGYLNVGYEYIIIDDCWASNKRDRNNQIQADPLRFPSGIKHLSNYIHNKGLKLGMLTNIKCTDRKQCLQYLKLDIKKFAEWGVDYVKFLYLESVDSEGGIIQLHEYVNQTGRPMIISCTSPIYQKNPNYDLTMKFCNTIRVSEDIKDSWESLEKFLQWYSDHQDTLSESGPGHWNDFDFLCVGNKGLSYEQSKLQMAIWAILGGPLIMSVDLRIITKDYRDILQNKELIKINQDPLGKLGHLHSKHGNIQYWIKPMSPIDDNAYSYAIAIINLESNEYPRKISFTLKQLNIKHHGICRVKNIFDKFELSHLSINDKIDIIIKPMDAVVLVVVPVYDKFSLP